MRFLLVLVVVLAASACGEDRIKGSPFSPSVTVNTDTKLCPDANGYLRAKVCP